MVAKSWRLIFLFVGFTGAGLPDDNWQKKQLMAVEAEMGSDGSGHAGKWLNCLGRCIIMNMCGGQKFLSCGGMVCVAGNLVLA